MDFFNEIARELVGDGKEPNLYFVTKCNEGDTIAILQDRKMAIDLATSLGEDEPIIVEDRLNGVDWMNEADYRIQSEGSEQD
jgi:hypothetical protein